MMTVHEVSEFTGVSIRTLQYYDKIGLLHPASRTKSGYRLYDDTALEKLQQILLFRALEFPLKEIKEILDSPDFDRNRVLEEQIVMLTQKRDYFDRLIAFARGIKTIGGKTLDFSVFDTEKMEAYAEQAKAAWGDTPEYREFEERRKTAAKEDEAELTEKFMGIFYEFGRLRAMEADTKEVQEQVKILQDFITDHFYTCNIKVLAGLGELYTCNESMAANIDYVGGKGTAAFVSQAIRCYCGQTQK